MTNLLVNDKDLEYIKGQTQNRVVFFYHAEALGCNTSCSGNCGYMCSDSCTGSCEGDCDGGCKGSCDSNCTGYLD